MQVDKNISAHIAEIDFLGTEFDLSTKQAVVRQTGNADGDFIVTDFTTYYDGLTAVQRTTIVNFFEQILADSADVTPAELTGTLFETD